MSDTRAMRAVVLVGGMAVLGGGATGCKITATFTCEDSTQCGADGICEPNHLCAFPDPNCLSGASYGDYSGAQSGVCVGEETGADAAGGGADARIDAAPDDPCQMWTFDPGGIPRCSLPPPAGTIDVTSAAWTLDGDTGMVSDGAIPFAVGHGVVDGVDVISVDRVTIPAGGVLRVTGSRPVLIASWSTITIDATGVVDASSNDSGRGPGSPAGACMPAMIGEQHATGDSGSGGAGFGANGGTGGRGHNGASIGGAGGTAIGLPAPFGAGCDGAAGAHGEAGGWGGGGIAIAARTSFTLGGVIHAGGQGGTGGSGNRHGGGGGGSGGMIRIEAAALTIEDSAVLAANGGQGGGGAGDNNAGDGVDGRASASPASSANGSGDGGGDGGAGGAFDIPAGGTGGDGSEGGGGGGGAVGYIAYSGHGVENVSNTAIQSPPALQF